MDNLTHTLIGLAAGEAVARCTGARPDGVPDPARRTALLAMGIVGGNLPDVDLLWSMQVFTGDHIAYLVEHRGQTHTFVGCGVLALLLWLGTMAVLRWRGHRIHAPDARLFGAVALLAVMLHLGLDALNVYGVHPFWPWNNRWYYGDAVFIVEPLFWLATAPLLFSLRTQVARLLLAFVPIAGCIAVLGFHRFGAVWWSLPLVTLLLLWTGRKLAPRATALATVALLCAVTGTFLTAHAAVSQRVLAVAAKQFPGAATLDVVLSPAPAHPLCWEVMLLQRAGAEYVARLGQFSLTSNAGRACAPSLGGPGTAPLVELDLPVVAGMRWRSEFSMPADELARLAGSNCDTRRLASFLRAPFATETDKGWIIGDLRFDREPGVGFAEALIDPQVRDRCSRAIPWTPPRGDLGF
ncbi:MAG TPA: metal-dependent hydrolase [Steroidobacteraceae bacterium]|nr:metal-dependent hydrolase [Steroidobacteraceae bacterium]